MNQLDTARRAQVVRCLVEGNSIRSTVRMTGVAKNTVVWTRVYEGWDIYNWLLQHRRKSD